MIAFIGGDCRDVLPTLDAEGFDCVVTSPPYWGLRDYGVSGQIGLEPTLDQYINTIAGVARELWRVLKQSGTFWLTLGDSYATGDCKINGLKPKDLCLVPSRVALRLQADGWWLRSAIVWAKQNPMPESVTDRPTSAYEMVFLLAKNGRYFFDADAIREPLREESPIWGEAKSNKPGWSGNPNVHGEKGHALPSNPAGRNARNVWMIAAQPYPDAHFAVMPPALVERCIKAGCPLGGRVLDPFAGAGTTGLVADRLGRHATLIDLNPVYCRMALDRVRNDAPLLVEAVMATGSKNHMIGD